MRQWNRFWMVLAATLVSCATSGWASGTRSYKIGQGFPFPPWDVGPMQGVSSDVLRAICEANGPMRCQIVVLPSQDCFDTDADGNAVVGAALASGRIDGCVTWFNTLERRRLGAEFGNGYSTGPVPQLIASDGNGQFDDLGESGSLDGARVGFLAGFFNDANCLATRYEDFDSAVFPSDSDGRSEMVAALVDGRIDLAFWDNPETVPEGAHLVGRGIATCGPELGLAVYPPSSSRKHASDELRRDYNCGLALIRMNGELQRICSTSPYPGGDPACVLEGPPPTAQCLEDNRPVP
jgi:ABC-type amino acid transport substrate-binding protein